ncbi:PAS domain-containing protein [Ferrimonas balearica]|nr:PAS domain-containing protein [Ferrimonas balearica]
MTMDAENRVEIQPLTHMEAFETLAGSRISMVLTDPSLPDNPIVYVNRAFERVTGYNAQMAIGRNCRFLQGEGTDPDDVKLLRDAIATQTDCTVDLVNYRADGEVFTNRLMLAPIFFEDGSLRYFLGIQKPLAEVEDVLSPNAVRHAMREVQHRVKNHLSMIVSLTRMYGRGAGAAQDQFQQLSRRIESLQVLYQELSNPERRRNMDTVSLGAYFSRLAAATQALDGRPGLTVNVDVEDAEAESEAAIHMGMIVSEILTNALQHAFIGRETGRVDLRVQALPGQSLRVTVADDGVGMPEGVSWPEASSVGSSVIAGLIRQLNGTLDVKTGATGTVVTLDLSGVTLTA